VTRRRLSFAREQRATIVAVRSFRRLS